MKTDPLVQRAQIFEVFVQCNQSPMFQPNNYFICLDCRLFNSFSFPSISVYSLIQTDIIVQLFKNTKNVLHIFPVHGNCTKSYIQLI